MAIFLCPGEGVEECIVLIVLIVPFRVHGALPRDCRRPPEMILNEDKQIKTRQ
jgi:hypothetical protein